MHGKPIMLIALALSVAGTGANAHTAWLVRDAKPGMWQLRFGGHQGKLEPAVGQKVRQVTAVDGRGRALPVTRSTSGGTSRISVGGAPAMIAMHYDNGIHTRTAGAGPSIERPMNQVPGAISAVNAQKYHKTIVRWLPVVARSIGQPFEITPLSAAQPVVGQPMRVQVRLDGRPVAGVRIGFGEDNAEGVTDAAGVATFRPRPGFNMLWAGRRIEQTRDPRYTQLSYEYLFTFDARSPA